nr:peptide chain release factor eRF1/aRF1 [Tanacetum cinerariifolium]
MRLFMDLLPKQLKTIPTSINAKNSSKGLIVACKLKSTSAENDNHVKFDYAKPDSMELETEKESKTKAGAEANSESLMKLNKIIRRIIQRV